jgi:SPP1 family predicted phage head-tail adaptor
MACRGDKLKIKTACMGDMRHKVFLYTRSIQAPDFNEMDFDESLTLFKTVWASIDNLRQEQIFDETNTLSQPTHRFRIRYIPGLTTEFWLKFRGNYYRILDVQNYQERNLFMQLDCCIRGSEDKPVNLV